MPPIVFTQFLYLYDEVRLALLLAILTKNNYHAVFWASELFYSGFQHELQTLLLKIYYDFFATLNPAYETHLLNSLLLSSSPPSFLVLKHIVHNLLFKPFNTDVFMLRNICEEFQVDIDPDNCDVKHWIDTCDFRSLAEYILNHQHPLFCPESEQTQALLDTAVDKKMLSPNVRLLAKLMFFFSKQVGLKRGKRTIVCIDDDDDDDDQDDHLVCQKPYQLLLHSTIPMNPLCVSLRNKKRPPHLQRMWRNHWEYYASFSPLWAHRIQAHGGHIDHQHLTVRFEDDDQMEAFYQQYGLEPDQQTQAVQDRIIPPLDNNQKDPWQFFYNTYKNNGLVEVWDEELEEFNVLGGLSY